MQYTLAWIAEKIAAKLHGDPDCLIDGVASPATAVPGKLVFCESDKHLPQLNRSQASAVLITENLLNQVDSHALVVAQPKLAFAELVNLFHPAKTATSGRHSTSVCGDHCQIDPSASIAANVVIGDNVLIGKHAEIGPGSYLGDNVSIGERSKLYANVVVYHGCQIGNECIVHSGVVIGADGFGFVPTDEGWVKMPQVGAVVIGNRCEIGANTTIDRGALEDTTISEGVKLDDLCMIAHNVVIGENTIIAGCTTIAGSTLIGNNCVIGGSTAIADHLTIADGVILSGGATVTRSLSKPGAYASGTGIQPRREWQKSVVRFRQLDKIYQRLKKVEQEVETHEP